MKLIDLLVQELPKRGGWPDGAESVVQDADDSEFYFFTGGPVKNSGKSWLFVDRDSRDDNSKWIFFGGKNDIADDCNSAIVTRAKYESALAASQKTAWNGEGLPPVGCECVVTPHNTAWGFSSVDDYTGRVLAYDGEDFWFVMLGGVKVTSRTDKVDFRPIKSEADKKRDAAINNILTIIDCNGVDPKNSAIQIYDAIAAGKIPGVKLED